MNYVSAALAVSSHQHQGSSVNDPHAEQSEQPFPRLSAAGSELTAQMLQQLQLQAREQFSRDLPLLLEQQRGRWVIYRGEEQLAVEYSEFEAQKSAPAAPHPQTELRTFWIMSGEDDLEANLDAA